MHNHKNALTPLLSCCASACMHSRASTTKLSRQFVRGLLTNIFLRHSFAWVNRLVLFRKKYLLHVYLRAFTTNLKHDLAGDVAKRNFRIIKRITQYCQAQNLWCVDFIYHNGVHQRKQCSHVQSLNFNYINLMKYKPMYNPKPLSIWSDSGGGQWSSRGKNLSRGLKRVRIRTRFLVCFMHDIIWLRCTDNRILVRRKLHAVEIVVQVNVMHEVIFRREPMQEHSKWTIQAA